MKTRVDPRAYVSIALIAAALFVFLHELPALRRYVRLARM